jgi:hypothetical protein
LLLQQCGRTTRCSGDAQKFDPAIHPTRMPNPRHRTNDLYSENVIYRNKYVYSGSLASLR